MGNAENQRRHLPSVGSVLERPGLQLVLAAYPRSAVVDAVRCALDRRRRERGDPGGIVDEVISLLRPSLEPVLNATGVILHTNLGRAPLAQEAVEAAVRAAGYCSLEWDRTSGRRGSRQDHLVTHLKALTGAQAACVANTNAGAVLLALCALGGGEVIVSRGQLVEIGGGFRIPDILAASGLRLVEVGTTNRTRIADYAAAIGPDTRALLRVHPSNFRTVGFTEEPSVDQIAALGRRRGLVVIDDLGSGVFDADPRFAGEPDARASIRAGCDLVCFSADKLIGGPQAGVIVGTAAAVGRCAQHPLMRALRPDKLTLAALEATLALHRDRDTAWQLVPTLRLIGRSGEERRSLATALAHQVGGEVVATIGRVGGGTLPLTELPSWSVVPSSDRPVDQFAAALRRGVPPLVTRVSDGRVLVDVLALDDSDLEAVARIVDQAER